MHLASGSRLGPYEIVAALGAGGMGEVYHARDTRLGRDVALKILPADVAGDRGRRQRFETEARAVAALNHPNIVAIYDVAFEDRAAFIVSELVPGETLRNVIQRGPVALRKTLDVAVQIADGLTAAHAAHIAHRDLKPENLMLTPEGRVKILDFGLAKSIARAPAPVDATRTIAVTQPGSMVGTAAYMSPEQASGNPEVDGRSDQFSLGLIVHEMITGKKAFERPTAAEAMAAIIREDAAPLPAWLQGPFRWVIERCLAKEPGQRYDATRDLFLELRQLRDHASEITSASAAALAASPPQTRGRRFKWITLAAAALVSIGAAAWWYPGSNWNTRAPAGLPAEFVRLTDSPGEENFPGLSPDGKQFIYASAAQGNWDIYLQRTGGSTAINLTRDCRDDDTQPALSHDGSRIVFRSERDSGGLFVMEATGENLRRITRRGYLPGWAPDGRHVVYSSETFTTPSARGAPISRLFIVDISDGAERQLDTADAIQPSWSPHGDRIAYWGIPGGGRRDIFTVAASGNGPPVPVTGDPAVDWYPVWSPSGQHLYFLSNRGGTMNIWRLPIDERTGRTLGPPEPVTAPAQFVGSLSLAADALVYSQASQRNSLAWIAFDPVHRVVFGVPEAAGGEHAVSNFSFSPDGSKLVVDTLGEATENLWIMNTDGSGRRRLTSDAYKNRAPAWSPNGEEILFFSDRDGRYENWLIRPDGSGLRPLTTNSQPQMQKAIWSPDGSRILAGRQGGSPVILDARAPRPVSNPQPAPGVQNERELLFNSWSEGDGDGVAIGHLLTGPTAPEIVLYAPASARLEHTHLTGLYGFWLRDGNNSDPPLRYFLFARGGDCLLYDRALQRESRLFSVAPDRFYLLATAPGGRRIYFTRTIRDADLWLARLK